MLCDFQGVVGRMMSSLPQPPVNVNILIPRTCDFVTLYGKKDFAIVIKLRILIWEDYLGELNVITKVFVRGWEKSVRGKIKFEDIVLLALKIMEGAMG